MNMLEHLLIVATIMLIIVNIVQLCPPQ